MTIIISTPPNSNCLECFGQNLGPIIQIVIIGQWTEATHTLYQDLALVTVCQYVVFVTRWDFGGAGAGIVMICKYWSLNSFNNLIIHPYVPWFQTWLKLTPVVQNLLITRDNIHKIQKNITGA